MSIKALNQSWKNDSKPAPPGTAQPPVANIPAYGENMWVGDNVKAVGNNLQLSLKRNSGYAWENGSFQPSSDPNKEAWGAAQAVLEIPSGQKLGYGKYTISLKIIGNTSWKQMLTNNITTTLGLFVYDPVSLGEIDFIEIGRQNQAAWQSGGSNPGWIYQQPPSPPNNNNAQFVIQPWDAKTAGKPDWDHLHRILIDDSQIPSSDEITIAADWSAEGSPVKFALAYGAYDAKSFPWSSAAFSWTSVANAPASTSTMSLYINLWPYGGSNTGEVEFQITGLDIPAFVST